MKVFTLQFENAHRCALIYDRIDMAGVDQLDLLCGDGSGKLDVCVDLHDLCEGVYRASRSGSERNVYFEVFENQNRKKSVNWVTEDRGIAEVLAQGFAKRADKVKV